MECSQTAGRLFRRISTDARVANLNRETKRRIFWAAAVFLLLFTAVDLALPASCGEEQESLNASLVRMTSASDGSAIRAASGDADGQHARQDDCFCCCAHVVAGSIFALSDPRAAASVRAGFVGRALLAARTDIYLPPRGA